MIINKHHDLFESLYEVLHFESAEVETGGSGGIKAARNLCNVALPAFCNHSAIFKCHNFRTQNMLAELKLVTCTPSVHETTGQSPSKVTRTLDGRGEEPPIGLESYVLPKLLDDAAKTEEEIEEFLTSQEETNDEESLNTHEKNMEKTKAQSEKEQLQGQSRAAVSITTLRGLDVDRGPADLKNFLVVIMAKYEGLYTAGCKEGRLSSKFTASDLQVISKNLLTTNKISSSIISIILAVTKTMGSLGYVKCMCLHGYLVDAIASEKDCYTVFVVTQGSHAKMYKHRAIHFISDNKYKYH
ncbi:hypothetical protein T4D_3374 [Trichinella pseudospiralis]|uniref:Uncharacterized protein n=1 Tax=Trichinella pseudospiralis TaxID=6337 RepID=A0A0V1FBS2_TRIPS|nr:hypothetical protein T4D_3374 [Trichinella pseudospiralis]